MTKLLSNLKKSNSGAAAAEYALIIAVIGGLIVVALNTFGTSISSTLTDTAAKLDSTHAK